MGIHVLFWRGSTSQRGISLNGYFASFATFIIILLLESRLIIVLFFLFDDTLLPFWSKLVYRGRGRRLLLVRGWLRKTSPQPLPTTILGRNMPALFHYVPRLRDFVMNLLLLLGILCLLEKMMPLLQISEFNRMMMLLTSVWKMLKWNWLDGWPSRRNSRRRMLIRS
ncbi:hypothetical protein AMTRI_Chr03g143160 [Amborella trichopoda]